MKRIALLALVVAVGVGCGNRGQDISAAKKADPMSPFYGKWADKPKNARVALEVKPDRQFVATFVIGSDLAVVKGEASASEKKLSLAPITINGKEPTRIGRSSVEFMTLGADGLSLESQKGPTLFKRSEETDKPTP